MRNCLVKGCGKKHYGKGYCKAHYQQLWVHGYIKNSYIRKNGNDIIIHDNYAEIVLRKKNGDESARTIIDIEDKEIAQEYTWSLHTNGYARCMYNGHTTYLHRVILGLNNYNSEVDHINRNKLDNRKINLRVCDHWINAVNKTISNDHGVFGICNTKRKLKKPFKVTLRRNNKVYNIGYYANLDMAKEVARQARIEIDKMLGIAL